MTPVTDAHTANILAYLRYNGMRGTLTQLNKMLRQFPESQAHVLRRMLAERGVEVK